MKYNVRMESCTNYNLKVTPLFAALKEEEDMGSGSGSGDDFSGDVSLEVSREAAVEQIVDSGFILTAGEEEEDTDEDGSGVEATLELAPTEAVDSKSDESSESDESTESDEDVEESDESIEESDEDVEESGKGVEESGSGSGDMPETGDVGETEAERLLPWTAGADTIEFVTPGENCPLEPAAQSTAGSLLAGWCSLVIIAVFSSIGLTFGKV